MADLLSDWLLRFKSLEGAWQSPWIVAGAAFLFFLFDTFVKPISAVSLGLIVLGLSPWIARYVARITLPGGTQLELAQGFQHVTNTALQVGWLDEQPVSDAKLKEYSAYFDDAPWVALAALRRDLEHRLVALADQHHVKQRRGGMARLAISLEQADVLTAQEVSVITDLLPLMNAAVHSDEFSHQAARWAITEGPQLLQALDNKIAAT